MTIGMDTVIVVTPDQVSSDLAGGTVILSMKSARYFGLSGVGTRVWELVAEPTEVRGICNAIVAEYEVDMETCERDVLKFLAILLEKGLVEVRDGA